MTLADQLASMEQRIAHAPSLPDLVAYAADAIADRRALCAKVRQMEYEFRCIQQECCDADEADPLDLLRGIFKRCDDALAQMEEG